MKKTTLALGVIAVLGLSYVGIAWHTGNVIENDLDKSLTLATEQFNNSQNIFKINISHSNDKKQLFSTKTHINMTLSSKDGSFAEVFTLADKDFTIHHGPFPLAALKQGIFSPQMAWVEFETSKESNPSAWKTNDNQPFITGYISLDYSESMIVKLFSKEISHYREIEDDVKFGYQLGKGSFTFTSNMDSAIPSITLDLDKFHTQKTVYYLTLDKLHIDLDGEKQSTMIGYNLHLDSLKTNLRDIYLYYLDDYEYAETDNDTFSIENLKASGTIDSINQNITLNANLDKFTLIPESDDERPFIILNKLSIKQKTDLSDTRVLNGSFISSVDSILYGQQNLGNAEIDIDYQGLDKEIFGEEFIDEETQYDQTINSKFELKNLNWRNVNGDVNIKGTLDIAKLEDIYNQNNPLDSINNLSLHVNAPLNVIAYSYAQYNDPHHSELTEEQFNESKKTVQKNLVYMFDDSAIFKFSKGEEQGLFIDIDILKDSNEANINGQIYNKSEVLDLFE